MQFRCHTAICQDTLCFAVGEVRSQREFVAPQGPQEDEALLGFSDYVGCVHASAQVLQFVNNQDFEVGNPIYLLPINAQSGSLCCLCFPDTDYFSAAFLY